MINWKFVKNQYKTIWVSVLIFGLILGFIAISGAFFKAFANVYGEDGALSSSGGFFILNFFLFGFPIFVIFFIYGLTTSSILINRDISRGYIVSWMTTSMSRKTIFNSKLFVFVSSILLINVWMILLELIVYGAKMADFNQVIGPLLVGNLSIMMLSLLSGAISWIIFSLIRKNGVAIGILMALLGWFLLCYFLKDMRDTNGDLYLKGFKYATITSFLNSPLNFSDVQYDIHYDGIWIRPIGPQPIIPLAAKDFAWQIPTMLVSATGLLTSSQFIIKNKDFAF